MRKTRFKNKGIETICALVTIFGLGGAMWYVFQQTASDSPIVDVFALMERGTMEIMEVPEKVESSLSSFAKSIVKASEAKQVDNQVEEKVAETPVVVEEQKPQLDTCHEWMNQAGIVEQDAAYELIMRESSCNPNAINPMSGACGIGQQLPCGKWEHTWNDPVGGMVDMQKYVFERYGSWAKALDFHKKRNWY